MAINQTAQLLSKIHKLINTLECVNEEPTI